MFWEMIVFTNALRLSKIILYLCRVPVPVSKSIKSATVFAHEL